MPELPEVEILVRHLAPLLRGKRIRAVDVRRERVVRPTSTRTMRAALVGARFLGLRRRGKYLLFDLKRADGGAFTCMGHLGMTGRMYLQPMRGALPKHAAVALDLGRLRFVYEDPRYFGRFTLDTSAVDALGPEPLSAEFTPAALADGLKRSAQPVKVKLLDQGLVAGIGNIYASEALFRASISPRRAARRLKTDETRRLHGGIRDVLREAIDFGGTIPLALDGEASKDRIFYYGRAAGAPELPDERLVVYDRAGAPCPRCETPVRRLVQAARSTFYCPRCQR